ncbi:MAG: TonB-dependent receptor, partial [Ekhidna sp.]|nr:TonB-dependent receptor [Ekhidna sp.]
MKLQFSFLAVFLLLSVLITEAQNGSLSGQVTTIDGSTVFATVGLENTKYGAITDIEGNFKIENIPVGSYRLKVSSVGFRSHTQVIEVKSSKLEIDVLLTEDLLNLETVVVSGTRSEQDRTESPVVVGILNNKIFNATQSIAISDGLNFQPGVRVETNCQNCGFTQVRLNGLEGSYSQILINSRPIFSALNSVYGLDQIPTNIVERVEVVRSGGSALYGSNAIAGTINIITKDPVENTWEGKSNTGLIDGDAVDQTYSFSGSVVNESLSSGVTFYGMSRNRDSYDANGDGFTELVELENTVLGAKAFFRPGDNSKITLDFSALEEYRRGGNLLELAPHFTDITEELDHNTFFGGLNYELWTKDNQNKFTLY